MKKDKSKSRGKAGEKQRAKAAEAEEKVAQVACCNVNWRQIRADGCWTGWWMLHVGVEVTRWGREPATAKEEHANKKPQPQYQRLPDQKTGAPGVVVLQIEVASHGGGLHRGGVWQYLPEMTFRPSANWSTAVLNYLWFWDKKRDTSSIYRTLKKEDFWRPTLWS